MIYQQFFFCHVSGNLNRPNSAYNRDTPSLQCNIPSIRGAYDRDTRSLQY